METWELAAREAIRDLVARYAHAADRGRFDDLIALFTDDGLLELPDGRIAQGHAAIRAMLADAGTSLRAATTVPWVRHHVSSHAIDVRDQTHAEGFAYFLVVTERGPDHWGKYHDRYVVAGDHWCFATRRVRVDGRAHGSWAGSRQPEKIRT